MAEAVNLKTPLEGARAERLCPSSLGRGIGWNETRAAEIPLLLAALLRLTRPGIMVLVAMAATAGMVLASGGMPAGETWAVCMLSLLMAAAGSVMLNSVMEHRRDRLMTRTLVRVAALDLIGRQPTTAIAILLIAGGSLIAFLTLTPLAGWLMLVAATSYLLVYTALLKQRSPFAAIPGALPGALPVLIGYCSVAETVGPDGVILFVLLFLWQPAHFWTFALRHRDDYGRAGLPVLADIRGESFTLSAIFLFATLLPPLSLAPWCLGHGSLSSAMAVLVPGLVFLVLLRHHLRRRRPAAAFSVTNWYLAVLFLAVILGAWP